MTDPTPPVSNAFETDQPDTAARSDAERQIEQLRLEGGVFVEAVRATRMPMAMTDPSLPGNPIVFANDAFLDLSGYSMDEVLGQQPHFMDGAGTDPRDARRFKDALARDRDEVVETVQYRKDGSRLVVSVFLSAFKDDAGRTLHQFLSFLDVTERETAEDALAASIQRGTATSDSEVRHRLLVESWTQAVWETDPKGVVVVDSPSWRAYTGQTVEEWLGYGWLDAIHPDDRANAERQWREAMAAGRPVNAEFRLKAPHGGWRWTNVRAAPVPDAGGGIAKWVGMNIDIDARRRAEDALRESEERLGLAMEVGELGAWDWDIVSGAVTWSREHFAMQGCAPGEVKPSYEAWLARVHPDDRAAAQQALLEARDGRQTYRNEMRGLLPDGRVRHLQAQGRFFYDEAGEAIRMIGVMRDVTDEKAAQEQLRQSEERYRSLFNSMDEAYAVVEVLKDAGGRWFDFLFLEVNPAFMVQTGMPYSVGKTAIELLGSPNPRWAELYGRVLDTGEPIRLEEHENSVGRMFDLNIFRLGDASDRRVAVLFFDITARKKAEAALRQREADLARVQRIGQVGGLDIDVVAGLSSRRSPEYLRLHGLPRDTAVETHDDWRARVHPDDRAQAEAALRTALQSDAGSYQNEYRIVRPNDGEVRWIQARADIERGDDGRALRLRGAHVDVTDQKQVQAALRESEQRFRALVTAGSYSIYRMSPDWRLMYQLESGTPARTVEPIENWVETYIPPEDLPAVKAAIAEAIRTRSLFELEHRVRSADGGVSWVKSRAVPILADDGQIIEWFGSGVDVTERHQAEQAVREGEERLRQFGEASQDVLWIRDRDSLQWRYLTPAFEAIYGLSREEALAGDNYHNWLSLIVPEDREQAEAAIRRVGAGEATTFEYRVRRPADGAIRWLRDTDFPIFDEHGEVAMIGGAGHDFTDVREAALRLKTLAEGIPQLVWRAVDIGEWTWASPQWVAYTGQNEPASHGRGWLEPVHPDDRAAAIKAWSRAVEEGGFEVELRIRRSSDKQYRWFKTRASPVRDSDGFIIEWLGTSTDVHDLRELQERQKVLVAELQHRTRNLMGVVRSTSEKTARSSADLVDFRAKFRDRIDALSRV